MNIINPKANIIAAGNLFLCIIKPINNAEKVAGAKSHPKNIKGFPKTTPKKVPSAILIAEI